MKVEKTKEKVFFDKDRELAIQNGKYIYKGIDVTPITKEVGTDFLSIMGRAGGKSFHNYFGLQDGKWYRFTGVTSALDYVGDKSNLMQWYANQVVEQFGWSKQGYDETAEAYKTRLNASMSKLVTEFGALPIDKQIEFILKARTAASTYGRKTANLGKDVHEQIEQYIKGCIKDSSIKGLAVPLKYENPQVQHFVDWAVSNKVIFKTSEFPVFSKSYWYAGTCDLVVEINGSLFIGDIKTTSSIWGRSYFAQCAAYRNALEEMYPGVYKFDGSILIRIGRDGLFNAQEDIHFSNYYEDDLKYFLAGLEIYRQENNVFQKD